MKIDLGFGNSVAVRDAFVNTYNKYYVMFGPNDLLSLDYPNHHGNPDLVKLTASIIKDQLNLTYKHIFITSGATGGCVISMRAYASMGYEYCISREAPYYIRYPKMIESSGLMRLEKNDKVPLNKTVALVDMPSNPLGSMDNFSMNTVPTILDGVYLNNIYMHPVQVKTILHEVLVGSYSKLLGINGIRLGWIATNDDKLASVIGDLVISEYCGLSTPSQEIILSTLQDFDWEQFSIMARQNLDFNRESFSKLEKFFQDTPVPDVGMFYYSPIDAQCKSLLEKANIHYTNGSLMGTNDDFGRFNIGQSVKVIHDAVKNIIKIDRI